MSAEKDVWKKNWQSSGYVLQSSEQLSLLLLIPWIHIVTGILNLLPGMCANSENHSTSILQIKKPELYIIDTLCS